MKSPGLRLYSSRKNVYAPINERADSRVNCCRLTVFSSPPLTEKCRSIATTPKSSSARACVNTSSRFVAFLLTAVDGKVQVHRDDAEVVFRTRLREHFFEVRG